MVIIARTSIRSASLRQQNRQRAHAHAQAQEEAAEMELETMHARWQTHTHANATERSDKSLRMPFADRPAQVCAGRRGQSDEHTLSLERVVLISNVYRMQAGAIQSAAAKPAATTWSWMQRLPSLWPHK